MEDKYRKVFENLTLPFEEIDEKAKTFTQQAYESIDCLQCGACCRGFVTTFTEDEIATVSKSLGISAKEFKKQYLIKDIDGQFHTISVPCPFLNLANNKCTIYPVRPKSCSSFPHTDLPYFVRRKKVHLANAKFCGITSFVLDEISKICDDIP